MEMGWLPRSLHEFWSFHRMQKQVVKWCHWHGSWQVSWDEIRWPVVVSKFFHFSPWSLGKWSNLTSIFFRWVETTNPKRKVVSQPPFFWGYVSFRECNNQDYNYDVTTTTTTTLYSSHHILQLRHTLHYNYTLYKQFFTLYTTINILSDLQHPSTSYQIM